MPRPPKIDDLVEGKTRGDLILQAIRSGAYATVAAEFAGVGISTYYRWLNGKGPRYREFREAVSRARAAAEVRAVGAVMSQIQGGAQKVREERNAKNEVVGRTVETLPGDGKLALEYLSRVAPDRYGRRKTLELVAGGLADASGIGDEEARRLSSGFDRWRAGRGPEAIEPPPARFTDEDDPDIEDAVVVDDNEEE